MSRDSSERTAAVRVFPPFRLDVRDERLWRGTEELKLRRKPFAILRYLTENPLHLVTQEALVEAVWGKIAMSESLLRTHIRELRRVLGEGVIETVVGRGYRFLLDVEKEKAPAPAPIHVAAPPAAAHLVGRGKEMDVLRHAFESVLGRKRQIVFVTGEPGIGKTALTDAFLAQVAAPQGALVATGSCVEQFGTGEAYLPILAALGAVCRAPEGDRIVDVLARHAPTWLAQMPGLVHDERLQAVQLRVQGASQARMLRELAETLDILAAERPVVLVLEDMQWCDPSTTDLVSMLGARRDPASVLLVATCRPTELAKGEGLARIMTELRARKHALSLELEVFSEAGVAEYLAERFEDARFPEELAATIHGMTGGNPLFASALIDDLETRGMIRRVEGHPQLVSSVAEVANRRPDTVRQLIDIQIDRLKANEQRILEAASLAGLQFTAGTVAHALELPADEVDSSCEGLAHERRFLRFVGSERWPDGTIQSRYSFVHALYRDAGEARVPAATKRVWHRRVAERLEAGFGEGADAIAPELAGHFDEAQALVEAVRWYCVAGERAMGRFGRAEALTHFKQARTLVAKLPASEESDRAELVTLKQVGPAIIALQGSRDPSLEATFERTAQLARKLGDDRGVLGALLGLQRCHFLRGDLRAVERYEGEVTQVVSRLADPVAAAEATVVSSSARLFRGQLDAAQAPLTEACIVLDAAGVDASRTVNAPVVGFSAGHLVVLAWLRGVPDQAIALAGKMVARAEALGDPFHRSTALTIAALTSMWRREAGKTLETARLALQVAHDAGSLVWQGRAMSLYHWAATLLEPQTASAHSEELSNGLAARLSAGPYGRTAFTPCAVEVYARAGQLDRALKEAEDALAFVEVSDERAWSAELHRLRGELVKDADPAEAEREIANGFEIAREQGAVSFELRAAVSLARLDRGPKKRRAALEQLKSTRAKFTEGFETGDLIEAATLLAR